MAHAGRQELLRFEPAEDLDELGDNPGPAGLVAGPQARAGVAVDVLVEENVLLASSPAQSICRRQTLAIARERKKDCGTVLLGLR